MTAKTETCTVFECDVCGDGWADNDDAGTPHFDEQLAKAVKQLADWEWTTDGDKHYCRACSVERLCAAQGHVWGQWVEAFNYSDPDWKTKPPPAEQRFCERDNCHERETRAAGTEGPVL